MSNNTVTQVFYQTNDVDGGLTASQAYTDAVLGPSIVGWAVQLMLTGIAISQFMVYLSSSHHSKDPKRTRYTVYMTMLLTIVNASLSFVSLYHYSTWQVRDSTTFESQTNVDAMSTLFVGIEGAIVQVYLANRAAKLFSSKLYKIIFFVVVGLAITASMAGAIHYTVVSWVTILAPTLPANLDFQYTLATAMWLVGQAFVDLLITVCLVFQLLKRVRGFSASTDSTIKKMITLTVASASYTALAAFIASVLDLGVPTTSIYFNLSIAFFTPLPAFYCLALLSNLNSRNKLQNRIGDSVANNGGDSNLKVFSHSGVSSAVNIELPLRSPTSPGYTGAYGNPNGFSTYTYYEPRYDSEKTIGSIGYTLSTHVEIDEGARAV